jgi:hypothetical protein
VGDKPGAQEIEVKSGFGYTPLRIDQLEVEELLSGLLRTFPALSTVVQTYFVVFIVQEIELS